MTRVWGCPSGAMVATVETTLSLIGDKWKALILRDLMPGTKRFGELKKSVGNVSQKVLTAQLRAMEENLKAQEVLTQHYSRQEYVTLNHTFHWLVVEASANKYYEKYLNELQNKVATYLLFWDSSTTNSLSLDLHLRIFEAFRDRDEQKGVLALMEDLQLAEECVRESQQL